MLPTHIGLAEGPPPPRGWMDDPYRPWPAPTPHCSHGGRPVVQPLGNSRAQAQQPWGAHPHQRGKPLSLLTAAAHIQTALLPGLITPHPPASPQPTQSHSTWQGQKHMHACTGLKGVSASGIPALWAAVLDAAVAAHAPPCGATAHAPPGLAVRCHKVQQHVLRSIG